MFCQTRGLFLSDKGTFVGQGDIFLSDKGTFFVRQGDITLKVAHGPSRPGGHIWGSKILLKPEDNQSQPTCKISLGLVIIVSENKRDIVRTDLMIYCKMQV